MASDVIATLLFLVGIINVLPAVGLLSSRQLSRLYGVEFGENNTLILMQHRALLFGIIGMFILYSAFTPALQPLAFIAGFISMGGFVLIAQQIGHYNELIKKFVLIDLGALGLLAGAAVLFARYPT